MEMVIPLVAVGIAVVVIVLRRRRRPSCPRCED
jgi:hypothetical protein